MPVVNQEMIRNTNRRLVLEYIVNNPPISRADFSQTTAAYQGHHFQYCAGTFRPKPDSGNRKCKTAMGRKPILLEFHKHCGYALAIDVRPGRLLL